jgi:TerC family integral membrane protein
MPAQLRLSAQGDELLGGNSTDITSLFEPGAGPTVILDGVEDVYRQAIQRTLTWVASACAFGGILWATAGATTGEEFFAGYLVEQSLSVDNLFVFLLLFDYFGVPLANQDRVLNWGIYGAIVMRAIMIGLGAAALQNFHAILLVFAGILVYSSAKVLFKGESEEEQEDLSDNTIVKLSHKFIESTDKYDGDKFFTVVDGIRKATPLFICMIAVEVSDVVFAIDSIPAVFGVTGVSTSSSCGAHL